MIARYGFREVKVKGGVLPPDVEISTIPSLRREFGDTYPHRIDPNCALSVETDYDQPARGRVRYARLPYRKHDDEAEMRKHVDPNWKRVVTRW